MDGRRSTFSQRWQSAWKQREGMVDERARLVDQLVEAIKQKLEANRGVLLRSLDYGRLTWRKRRNGELEIDLEPKL